MYNKKAEAAIQLAINTVNAESIKGRLIAKTYDNLEECIKELSKVFDDKSNNFFGIHIFNPPYNLSLYKLICYNDSQKYCGLK